MPTILLPLPRLDGLDYFLQVYQLPFRKYKTKILFTKLHLSSASASFQVSLKIVLIYFFLVHRTFPNCINIHFCKRLFLREEAKNGISWYRRQIDLNFWITSKIPTPDRNIFISMVLHFHSSSTRLSLAQVLKKKKFFSYSSQNVKMTKNANDTRFEMEFSSKTFW